MLRVVVTRHFSLKKMRELTRQNLTFLMERRVAKITLHTLPVLESWLDNMQSIKNIYAECVCGYVINASSC